MLSKKPKGPLCFKNQIVLKKIVLGFIFKPSVPNFNFPIAQSICSILGENYKYSKIGNHFDMAIFHQYKNPKKTESKQ